MTLKAAVLIERKEIVFERNKDTIIIKKVTTVGSGIPHTETVAVMPWDKLEGVVAELERRPDPREDIARSIFDDAGDEV